MSSRMPKELPEELLILMAAKFRMLGEPTRLAILHCLLDDGEQSVGEIVEKSGRSLANVSKHLKQMAEAGLVTRRRQGTFALYRTADPVVEKICTLVCDSLRKDLEAEVAHKSNLLKRGRRQ